MPSALATASCVPPKYSMASCLVITPDYRHADLKVNRHADSVQADYIGVPMDITTVGGRLRYARKLRQLNQHQLAKLAGIKQPSVSEIETGETKEISGPVLIALSKALRVRPEWLILGGHEPVEPEPDTALSNDERELLQIYRGASSRWKVAVKYMAKLRQDEKQEEAIAYVLSLVTATPVPDSKLGDKWTRPDKKG